MVSKMSRTRFVLVIDSGKMTFEASRSFDCKIDVGDVYRLGCYDRKTGHEEISGDDLKPAQQFRQCW